MSADGPRAATDKPAIVIVPGSFTSPSFYSTVVSGLEKDGYEVTVVDLPSTGRRENAPPATMAEDAAEVQLTATKLAEEGKDILLVAHSYGGVPATESIKGLAKSVRSAEGKKGGIFRVCYLCCIVPGMGQSTMDLMGSDLPPYVQFDGEYLVQEPIASSRVAFSDLPEEEALKWARQMRDHSAVSFSGALTYAGYADVDVSYILCEADQTIPPATQQLFIDTIENATGKKVDVMRLDSGHCPNASKPEAVIRIVEVVAGL